ncbi:MAG: dTDP-4-dehydrorhamnose reductase [Parvularculaceae bacterium]|nr:dTDP-4-dehydrorhamnose reductase [Parvularculaceae bacterium]
MKVLVVGRSGQVAASLVEAVADFPSLELVAEGRPDLDIGSSESIASAMERHDPDLVINAAAYTAVDLAENERDDAFLGNETGPRLLAEATAAAGIPLFHISTDYVFNGQGTAPYLEEDPVAPLGVYGESKLAGEKAVAAANPRHLILRTAWVYGAYGKNFLKTMLRVAEGRDELGVVADQKGAPTSSHDIATALLQLSTIVADGRESWGTYHLVSGGEAVWADFAEAIFEASAKASGPNAKVNRIGTDAYPTPAARPAYSVLNNSKLRDTFGIELPHWSAPVEGIVERVLKEKD